MDIIDSRHTNEESVAQPRLLYIPDVSNELKAVLVATGGATTTNRLLEQKLLSFLFTVPDSSKLGVSIDESLALWKPMVPKNVMKTSPPEAIAVHGVTGSRKSSFVTFIEDREISKTGIDHGATYQMQIDRDTTKVQLQLGHSNILLVDTPGFNSSKSSDAERPPRLVQSLQNTYKSGISVSGMFYWYDLAPQDMDQPLPTVAIIWSVEFSQQLFGQPFLMRLRILDPG